MGKMETVAFPPFEECDVAFNVTLKTELFVCLRIYKMSLFITDEFKIFFKSPKLLFSV